MLRNIYKTLVMIIVITACNSNTKEKEINSVQLDVTSTEVGYAINRLPLSGNDFKVPVPQGYNWEITQSWEQHCQYCNSKGYDKIYNGYFGDFCQISHSTADPKDYGCFEYCKFGWDFNLSENDDFGKSVLASGDGVVLIANVGKDSNGKYKGGSWGNTVVIDHGNNICSRYAHMKDSSVTVVENQEVCQGLKIGEVGDTPSVGAHLHFQFEDCETHKPLEMGFTDGNGVPKCVIGNDVYTNGFYTALKLTNVEKDYCTDGDLSPKDPNPPEPDPPQVCEMQCPMTADCANTGETPFKDLGSSDSTTSWAVNYLWHECAVSGKSDGDFHKDDNLTRAEALKIALTLFGLDKGCEGTLESFTDVNPTHWFYPYVVCGVKYGVISKDNAKFNPEQEVYFSEAAKMAVESAVKAKKAEIKTGMYAKFLKLTSSDWSYKYLQTIAYYNGIDKDLLQYDPYEFVTRGEYARMITSLSPCYCYKNKCQSGCECNQSYMCGQGQSTVLQDENPGNGQYGGSTGEQDAGSFSASSGGKDAQTCKPYCYKKECGSDLCGGNCGTCGKDMFCGMDAKCNYICQSQSCEELGCECGKCAMTNPGCDGLSKLCGSCGEGQICNSANKCQADPCYNCPAGKCIGGQCMKDVVKGCDPAKGYYVKLYTDSPEAKLEILDSWSKKVAYTSFFSGSWAASFGCVGLPEIIRISNLTSKGFFWLEDPTFEPFMVWSYPGNEAPFWPPPVDSPIVTQSFTGCANCSFLLKLPYK
ncbi:MAG: peptidoglycan DD-metalloendopeptidase family protein [Candidatus Peregrinibacteria bacterium]|nr:peptidoglycan DD-metalloendopeptidase family protein [Candidatus Peregrinibacteria bacterium]